MALKPVWIAAVSACAVAWYGSSVAQGYLPDEFFSLDLSKAVFSPTPLGPAASFKPGPLDVTVDRKSNAAHASAAPEISPKISARAERPVPHRPRAPVALHRGNPVEAQARDVKIQTWPCKSGGICNWKR
ncbi:MAG TPA: hypothetical protein VKT76_05015 [Bradyrhizobium sp.]|nr:hypothetical protein [Bradyrhizobium sp.]